MAQTGIYEFAVDGVLLFRLDDAGEELFAPVGHL